VDLFSKEKGRFFGDHPDHIVSYSDIDADECARRCLRGFGSYDGVSRVCSSFNHRPAGSPEGGSARCWLRSSAKDIAGSPGPEWDSWPHRNYYQRKGKYVFFWPICVAFRDFQPQNVLRSEDSLLWCWNFEMNGPVQYMSYMCTFEQFFEKW